MRNLLLIVGGFSVLFYTSCTKQNKVTTPSALAKTHATARKTNQEYITDENQAGITHNAYLEYMYSQYHTGQLLVAKTAGDFTAALSVTGTYLESNDVITDTGMQCLSTFMNQWNSSNQSAYSFFSAYVSNNSSNAFQGYSNSIFTLISTMDTDFITKSNVILNTALNANDLTDSEMEGLACAIGAAQGSFNYWRSSANIVKWTGLTGTVPSSVLWGAFFGADGAGALAGCAYGAWCGPLGAGAGAVGGAAFASACVALDWD